MKAALADYGQKIKRDGWEAGENLITKGEKQWKDFRKWAYALGIMLRAEELLTHIEEVKYEVNLHPQVLIGLDVEEAFARLREAGYTVNIYAQDKDKILARAQYQHDNIMLEAIDGKITVARRL